ncbi:hypothetical protein A2576_00845 [Candidatus Amesbacteria bacterium RIFOXYD1_FULL_47_9]|uniref:Methyltransferase type 11 domain-containing protein n=1 Tax=Candidatus Amesbacteria bacterium RIFOXYD1_FULL_47_9 TaxID=1797267 RepID=A0A1F5A1H9_9BACT|nr:MAG: hypothetical protein A2576_00845 [Candidatus Amesbacteria bacterium RIFOXYD1_FULL_47_9]
MITNDWTDTDVADFWDHVAPIYIRENNKVHAAHVQRFTKALEFLDLKPGHTLLNICSRDCEAADYIHNACPDISIIHAEISQKFIDLSSRSRPAEKQVKVNRFSRLPFPSKYFDRILSLETLEHTPQPLNFLRELHRVAKNTALLVLSCPPATAELPYRVYSLLFGGHGEGPHRFLSSKVTQQLLSAAGWTVNLHQGTLLLPLGPRMFRSLGERLIARFPDSLISEFGIRQIYVCQK